MLGGDIKTHRNKPARPWFDVRHKITLRGFVCYQWLSHDEDEWIVGAEGSPTKYEVRVKRAAAGAALPDNGCSTIAARMVEGLDDLDILTGFSLIWRRLTATSTTDNPQTPAPPSP